MPTELPGQPDRVVHVKQLARSNTQAQDHMTVRELWNYLYSLVLSGHGDDCIRMYFDKTVHSASPTLLGILRASRTTEVWISDTDDVL